MKNLYQKYKKQGIRGFTLVETMVAIFILTLVVAISMGGIQKSLQTSVYSRDQITAFYLAEEAIEYVRAVRDSNYLNGPSSWLTNISQCVSPDNGTPIKCSVDAFNGSLNQCGSGSEQSCVLEYHPSTHIYDESTNSDGQDSKFSRYITIQNVKGDTADQEVTVTATVEWNSGPFGSQSYTLSEELFNTKQ